MASLTTDKPVVGWREWIRLDSLQLPPIKAKIDTGARTSALHAFKLETFVRGGSRWVRFSLHPNQRQPGLVQVREAPIIDRRSIADSGGHRQMRYIIQTDLTLGGHTWPIELSLTSRDTMRFRMLLGRTALGDRFIIDPARSYCIGKKPKRAAGAEPTASFPHPGQPREPSAMSVTLYHNPRCGKSRNALELLRGRGIEPRIVEYLKTPPSPAELASILDLLGLEPRALIRKGETAYHATHLDDPALDRAALIAAMVAQPVLIERPILLANGKAALGRPPENILAILD